VTSIFRNAGPGLYAGATLTGFIFLLAVLSPVLAGFAGSTGMKDQLAQPSLEHPLGCDEQGGDLLARLAGGAGLALTVGVVTVMLSLSFGAVVGSLAGYMGGAVDEVAMRIIDMLMAFPGVLLAIGIVAVTRNPSNLTVILAIAATGWVPYARLARAQALTLKGREFVLAARVMGATASAIVRIHLLPNMLSPLVVQATFGMASAILAEASLSFLGLGPQGSPSWGALMDQGTQYISIRWHLALFPGLALFITVLGLNLLGDALRDMMDPRQNTRSNGG
jgi:peptide/nickel transport system permease protein